MLARVLGGVSTQRKPGSVSASKTEELDRQRGGHSVPREGTQAEGQRQESPLADGDVENTAPTCS